jgi:hypothetical protein
VGREPIAISGKLVAIGFFVVVGFTGLRVHKFKSSGVRRMAVQSSRFKV